MVFYMHEYAVTKNILEIVLETANNADAKKVLEIRLEIGELSSFEEGSIKMYFDMLSKDTIAQGSKIEVKKIAAMLYCKSCDLNYSLIHIDFNCPQCGEVGTYRGSGKDFLIESIEVE